MRMLNLTWSSSLVCVNKMERWRGTTEMCREGYQYKGDVEVSPWPVIEYAT
jgi:hypothetical protein